MKKLVCSELPLLFMNPKHHPVTMANKHGFLPRGIEGQAKNSFSAAPSLGFATLDQCKNWGPVNWSPSGHLGLAAASAT